MRRPLVLAAALVVCAAALVAEQPAMAATAAMPDPGTPAPAAMVSADPAAYAQALTSPDWVKTPAGLMNKACGQQLPHGAILDGDTIVYASGARQPMRPCAYPRLVGDNANVGAKANVSAKASVGAPAKAAPAQAIPTTNGWMITTWWQAPSWIRRMYIKYGVPGAPQVSGATNFIFGSLEPLDGTSIVQPVLTYGKSGYDIGGNYWYITSWYVWGTNFVTGDPIRVSTGDTIYGQMEGNNCRSDGSGCHWAIRTRDETKGTESRLDVVSQASYQTAQSGVLESYGAQHCNMLPSGRHIAYRNAQLWGPTFNVLDPGFYVWQIDDECGMEETLSNAGTGADITWTG